MPPDIMAGPLALAGGMTNGRALGATGISPPGSDPLAALFASLLAQSSGPPAPTGAASSLLTKNAPAVTKDARTETETGKDKASSTDKTAFSKTANTALPALPLPVLPIAMKPTETQPHSLPIAEVTAGKKTMDTAKDKPSSELPLPQISAYPAPATMPAMPIVFPVIIVSASAPVITSVTAAAPMAQAIAPVNSDTPDNVGQTAPSPNSGGQEKIKSAPTAVFPNPALQPWDFIGAGGGAAALPGKIGSHAIVQTQAAPMVLPETLQAAPLTVPAAIPAPAALPVTFTVSQTANAVMPPQSPKAAAVASKSQPGLPTSAGIAAPKQPAAVYTPTPQGLAVRAETIAASAPTSSQPNQASVPLTVTLPAVNTVLVATTLKDADPMKSTDGTQATDGVFSTPGVKPSQGKLVLAAGPEKISQNGLKSAALPADNNTRIQTAATAKDAPDDPMALVTEKRSERRDGGADDAAATVLTPQAAQAVSEAERTEAKPLTATERAEMVRQVADGVEAMRLPAQPGKADQMTLQLHPKEWGSLQVSVIIAPASQPGAAQTVTAHLVAETPQVKAALESHSGDLRQALREAGLTLDKMTVTVQSAAASAQAGTASSGHHGLNNGTGDGGYSSQSSSDQQTGMSPDANNPGTPSFAAFAGHSQGGRQGSQPSAYAANYPRMEQEREELPEAPASRRVSLGQVDIRA